MAAGTTDPKLDPAVLVSKVFDATEAGAYEVLADDTSVQLKAALSAPLEVLYTQLADTEQRGSTGMPARSSDRTGARASNGKSGAAHH